MAFKDLNIKPSHLQEALSLIEAIYDPFVWLNGKLHLFPRDMQAKIYSSIIKYLLSLNAPPRQYIVEAMQSFAFAKLLARICKYGDDITEHNYVEFLNEAYKQINNSDMPLKDLIKLNDALEKQHEELIKDIVK